MPQVRGLRFAVAGLVIVFAAAADAATISLYPSTSDAPTGAVSTPAAALATGDGAGAGVSSNNAALTVRGFPGTPRGTITAVSAVVRYRTTAPPLATSPDRYRFELALDGATFSRTILADAVANQPAYVEAHLALGALSWTEIAAAAVRCTTTKVTAPDGYVLGGGGRVLARAVARGSRRDELPRGPGRGRGRDAGRVERDRGWRDDVRSRRERSLPR